MVQFIDMWRGHPTNESIDVSCRAQADITNVFGKTVRAGDPAYDNQSPIRFGVALRKAGVRIDDLGPKMLTCAVHEKSEMHCIGAKQIADALRRAKLPGFGAIEIITGGDVERFYDRIYARTGVIYLQNIFARLDDKEGQQTGDLIDLWNGYRTTASWLMDWLSWAGYRSNYKMAREIWFWPVS